jgi:hypothetical protein
VKRYQSAVGIGHLSANFDKNYLEHMRMGYFEPIPLAWTKSNVNPLTKQTPGSEFEDEAGM